MKLNSSSVIEKIRTNGARYFAAHGLPTRRDEDWKYTSLKGLTEASLSVLPKGQKKADLSKLSDQWTERLKSICVPQFINLVFVDGVLASHPLLPLGITISELSKSVDIEPFLRKLKKSRKRAAPVRQDSLEALNSANFRNGIFIAIPEGKRLNKPIQIVSVITTRGANYPKIFVSLEAKAQLSLIETNLGGVAESTINSVTEILLGPSAKLNYIRFQNQDSISNSIACTRIYLMARASLESLSVHTGAQLSRHNMDIYCLGKRAQAQVNGLVLGAGTQIFDNHTHIDHVVGNCTTTQLYKSILDGQAHSVFNGRVHIRPQAQKASSEQLNNNLLLGSGAEADSKPQLNVHADDVKATHGSTVGQLDVEELFYFLSRGISQERALEMLALGFAQDLMDRISDPVIRIWMRGHLKAAYLRMKEKLP